MNERCCTIHRLSSGVALSPKTGDYIRFGLGDGAPDLVGWIHGTGRMFAVEVKTAKGRLRPNQRAWIEWASRTGVYACVARSPEEAVGHLRRAVAGEPASAEGLR